MITTKDVGGVANTDDEQPPRAKLITKDGKSYDYGPIQIGVKEVERLEFRKYVYSGEREGIYRIFREQ